MEKTITRKKDVSAEQSRGKKRKRSHLSHPWQLYVMISVPFLWFILFSYGPMYGILLAFKRYKIRLGILGSPWAENFGFENFIRFFNNYNFWQCLRNTFVLSLYSIAVGMPLAVIFALMLNYMRRERFRKTVQLTAYSPYFISQIIMVGILTLIFDPRTGVLGQPLYQTSGVNILADAGAFPTVYVLSGVWQNMGFDAILYIAALSSVDPQLHEAALIDGATILQRIKNIDIPAILPTFVIMLIMRVGQVLNIGQEKALAMQNVGNMETSEIISTYAYKIALASEIPDFSYSTAISFFQAIVGLVLIIAVNRISRKLANESLW